MLSYKEFLNERIENLFFEDEKRRKELAQQVFDLLQNAYSYAGGIKGDGFKSPEDMIKNISMWKIFRRGDDVKAVLMYKDKRGTGRKAVASGTDGSKEGIIALANMVRDEFLSGRAFAEKSDKALKFLEKQIGKEGIKKIAIPVEKVKELLPGDEIFPIDDYYYKRLIGGDMITKIMVGNPDAPPIRKR